MMRNVYEKLYNDPNLRYGQAKHDRCPGVRYYPLYRYWLKGSVIDLGCGTGDTVELLRSEGFRCTGIDQINTGKLLAMGDITEPLEIELIGTSLALDVFEHLPDSKLTGLINNMEKTERQVITVHSGSHKVHGVELHVNQKTKQEWTKFISKHFLIADIIELEKDLRFLYLCAKG